MYYFFPIHGIHLLPHGLNVRSITCVLRFNKLRHTRPELLARRLSEILPPFALKKTCVVFFFVMQNDSNAWQTIDHAKSKSATFRFSKGILLKHDKNIGPNHETSTRIFPLHITFLEGMPFKSHTEIFCTCTRCIVGENNNIAAQGRLDSSPAGAFGTLAISCMPRCAADPLAVDHLVA